MMKDPERPKLRLMLREAIDRAEQLCKEEREEREKIDPIYKEGIAKAEQEKLSELERISQLKEKRIVDEQQKLEEMNKLYTEKLEKIENENIIALEEINKLKEKRILEEHSPVICIELPTRDEEEQTYKIICKNILGGLGYQEVSRSKKDTIFVKD